MDFLWNIEDIFGHVLQDGLPHLSNLMQPYIIQGVIGELQNMKQFIIAIDTVSAFKEVQY